MKYGPKIIKHVKTSESNSTEKLIFGGRIIALNAHYFYSGIFLSEGNLPQRGLLFQS